MQVPVEIAFRHCEPLGEIRSEVAKQVRRLEKFSPRITSCHVIVTGPETRHRRGGLFEVELRIADVVEDLPRFLDAAHLEDANLPQPRDIVARRSELVRPA